jgi:hypothetical protein
MELSSIWATGKKADQEIRPAKRRAAQMIL